MSPAPAETMPATGKDGPHVRSLTLPILTMALAPAAAAAQPAEPIAYTLRFPAPHTHYVTVDAPSS